MENLLLSTYIYKTPYVYTRTGCGNLYPCMFAIEFGHQEIVWLELFNPMTFIITCIIAKLMLFRLHLWSLFFGLARQYRQEENLATHDGPIRALMAGCHLR